MSEGWGMGSVPRVSLSDTPESTLLHSRLLRLAIT
jgi:hypothetical protein